MSYLYADNENTFECPICQSIKQWYYFEFKKGKGNKDKLICFKCQEKHTINQLTEILKMASENNMQSLRDKLFDCITDLKAKKITTSEAKEICSVAQVIINSVKVEVDYMKAIGAKKGGAFMELDGAKN